MKEYILFKKSLPFDTALDIVKKAAKRNNLEATIIFPKDELTNKGSKSSQNFFRDMYAKGWNTADITLKKGFSKTCASVTGVPSKSGTIVHSVALDINFLFREKNFIKYKKQVQSLVREYTANN